jgi:Flp pilus assembly protein TadD
MYVLPVLLIGSWLLLLLWRNHPVGFLGAWFGAILSPTLIVPIVTEMAAERRMYLPLAMLLAIFVIGGYLLLQRISTRGSEILKTLPILRRPMAGLICVTCLVAFIAGLASARRVQAYYQPLGLWRQVLEYLPADHTAYENVAYYLSQNQQIAAAIEEFRKAIEVDPRAVQARYNLASLLLTTGKADEAVELLRQAVSFVPRDYKMRSNLATALMLANRYDEALTEFQATLELNPNDATILKNMGIAQRKVGKFSDSVATFEKALRVNPQAADLYLDLAVSYDDSGDRESAIAKLEEGLKKARTVGNTQLVSRIEAKLDQLTKPARR